MKLIIKLTNHLGDSGMKNVPSTCMKLGIVPERVTNFKTSKFINSNNIKWYVRHHSVLPIRARLRQAKKFPKKNISEKPMDTENCKIVTAV